jgi:hypothetical protein
VSDFIAKKIAEREAVRTVAEQRNAAQDKALRKRIADKMKNVAIVKKAPFWWVPAFFRGKLELAAKVGELDRMVFDYADFCKRQSSDLKALYKWALEHDPKDGSLDPFKERLGPLDPADIIKGAKFIPRSE